MNRQHNIRKNLQRERQKSLKRRLAENRANLEFFRRTLQIDIDDDNGDRHVQSKSTED